MGIVKSVLRLATWWNGSTLGTWLFTALKGRKVGEDAAGERILYLKKRTAPLGDL